MTDTNTPTPPATPPIKSSTQGYVLLALYTAILIGVGLAAAPYVLPHLPTVSYEDTQTKEELPAEETTAVQPAPDTKPRSIVWEVPPGTQDIIVEVYNADNSYSTYYTITNYISLEPGQKLKVIAK